MLKCQNLVHVIQVSESQHQSRDNSFKLFTENAYMTQLIAIGEGGVEIIFWGEERDWKRLEYFVTLNWMQNQFIFESMQQFHPQPTDSRWKIDTINRSKTIESLFSIFYSTVEILIYLQVPKFGSMLASKTYRISSTYLTQRSHLYWQHIASSHLRFGSCK